MLADLELLDSGRSVKCKRAFQRRWAMLKQAIFALFVLAVIATGALSLRHQFRPSDFSGEGPPSPIDEANTLCDKAMKIIRNDEYAAFQRPYKLQPRYCDGYQFRTRLRACLSFAVAKRFWS
jgi:hypothetical protein